MILSSTKDRSQWLDIISEFPIKYHDIYFHPDYVSLNCKKKIQKVFYFTIKKMIKYG